MSRFIRTDYHAYRFSYHTGRSMNLRVASYRLAADESSPRLNLVTYDAQIHYIDEDRTHTLHALGLAYMPTAAPDGHQSTPIKRHVKSLL